MLNRFTKVLTAAVTVLCCLPVQAEDASLRRKTESQPSLLIKDFAKALDAYAGKKTFAKPTEVQRLWVNAFKKAGIKPEFLERRLNKSNKTSFVDPFAKFQIIEVETVTNKDPAHFSISDFKTALHVYRFDVKDEYDDFSNDDIYMYFITTHDDLLWGRVTSVYRNIGEGESIFFNAEDRGIFGPKGEKLTPRSHLIVDYGIIESDGEDVEDMQKLSAVIVDLALVALTVYNPQAGVAAEQARAETKNLLKAIVALNQDDRLVTDSIYFTPQSLAEKLKDSTYSEFGKRYEHATWWTRFNYQVNFRLLR